MRCSIRFLPQAMHMSSAVGRVRFPRCVSVIQTKNNLLAKSLFRRCRHSGTQVKTKKPIFTNTELTPANQNLASWVQLCGRPKPPNYMSNALFLYRSIRKNGFDPNMRAYRLMLQACSADGNLEVAVSIIGEVVGDHRKAIHLDCNCVESLLASCRRADLQERTADGVPLWQAVLVNVEKAIIYNNFLPSKTAFEQILRLCCCGEKLSLAFSYAKQMVDFGLFLPSKSLDELLILCEKKGTEQEHLVQMLKERSTEEIVYMRQRSVCKKQFAHNTQRVVERCLRHNVILSSHTFASAILRMHDGGLIGDSLALLKQLLDIPAGIAEQEKFLPPPRKLLPMWRTCSNDTRLRRRTIETFVLLHKRCFQMVQSDASEHRRKDLFHGSMFWDIVCKSKYPDDIFGMVQGLPYVDKVVHRPKVFMILEKAASVCASDPAQMEFLIRYMQELGKPMAHGQFPDLVASYGRNGQFKGMLAFMQFLLEHTEASLAIFPPAMETILSSTLASRCQDAHNLEGLLRTHVPKPDPELLAQLATVYAQSDRWDNVLDLVYYMKSVQVPRELEFYSVVLRNKCFPKRRVPLQLVAAINEDADAPDSFSWIEITEHFSCDDDLAMELIRMLELRYKNKRLQEEAMEKRPPRMSISRRDPYDRPYQPYDQTPQIDNHDIPSVLYTNRLSMSYVFSSLKTSPGPPTV